MPIYILHILHIVWLKLSSAQRINTRILTRLSYTKMLAPNWTVWKWGYSKWPWSWENDIIYIIFFRVVPYFQIFSEKSKWFKFNTEHDQFCGSVGITTLSRRQIHYSTGHVRHVQSMESYWVHGGTHGVLHLLRTRPWHPGNQPKAKLCLDRRHWRQLWTTRVYRRHV